MREELFIVRLVIQTCTCFNIMSLFWVCIRLEVSQSLCIQYFLVSRESWYIKFLLNLSSLKVFIIFKSLSDNWVSLPSTKWVVTFWNNFVARATFHWQELSSLGIYCGRQLYFSSTALLKSLTSYCLSCVKCNLK